LKIRFKLVLDLVLKAANRLHSEVIISRHIIPNNTKVPPSHTGVVFLPCGTEVTRGREEEEERERTCIEPVVQALESLVVVTYMGT
jgi:hypothetical protein